MAPEPARPPTCPLATALLVRLPAHLPFTRCMPTKWSPTHTFFHEDLAYLRQNLELPTDPDFRIVLAAAERLQPGAYASMYGDPTMREESIVNLFSAF